MAAIVAILNFWLEWFQLLVIYIHPDASYQVSSTGFPCRRRSEKDFQDGYHGGHLWFPIRTTWTIFDIHIILMLLSKFQVNCSGEEAKNSLDFQDGCHLGFPNGTIIPFFSSTSHLDDSYCFSSVDLLVQAKERKIDIQDGSLSSYLGFPIGTILAFFFCSSSHPITLYQTFVNWPFSAGEEAKMDFQDDGNLGFPIRMILATFDLKVTQMLPTVSSQLACRFRRRSKKQIFKMAPRVAILVFQLERIFM